MIWDASCHPKPIMGAFNLDKPTMKLKVYLIALTLIVLLLGLASCAKTPFIIADQPDRYLINNVRLIDVSTGRIQSGQQVPQARRSSAPGSPGKLIELWGPRAVSRRAVQVDDDLCRNANNRLATGA